MNKKWFQLKELMAGSKRLLLSYKLYKLFGEFPIRIIAFFVVLGGFLSSKERREFSYEYFKILSEYTNRDYPLLPSAFKQFLNYGNTLVDKIISFSGNLSVEKFAFIGEDTKRVFELLKEKKGIFFLTTHVGNVEILRSLLMSDKYSRPTKANIFMEKRSCEVFNSFIKEISVDTISETYAVEDIGADTAIELSQKLDNGEIIFMAGDRVPYGNEDKIYETVFLGKTIKLPVGALKLAQVLRAPIFFIVCAKIGNRYNIHTKMFKPESTDRKLILEQLKEEYTAFLEQYTIQYPEQFYHFYKLFEG